MTLARPVFFVLLAASLFGFRSDDTFSLVPKRVKGDVLNYQMTMNISAGSVQVVIHGKSRIKVLSVEEDGGYELEESMVEGKMTANGNEQELPVTEPKPQKYDKHGKRIKKDGEGDNEDPSAKVLGDAMDYIPDHVVKIGETWTREFEFGTVKSKLEGKEKVGEVDCLKVSVETTLKSGGTASATFFVREADSSIEKGTTKFEHPTSADGTGPTRIETEIVRAAD